MRKQGPEINRVAHKKNNRIFSARNFSHQTEFFFFTTIVRLTSVFFLTSSHSTIKLVVFAANTIRWIQYGYSILYPYCIHRIVITQPIKPILMHTVWIQYTMASVDNLQYSVLYISK